MHASRRLSDLERADARKIRDRVYGLPDRLIPGASRAARMPRKGQA
jgi:hypothetical protein